MSKTGETEYCRKFLIERLPEPLTTASSHLQIFDNYIDHTRFRLRSIRDPHANVWSYVFQQRVTVEHSGGRATKIVEMHLDEGDYKVFEQYGGRQQRNSGNEIRKNRYFHDYDNHAWRFDVYLGDPTGVIVGAVEFANMADSERFERPPFALIEITNDEFFDGRNLIRKTSDEIRAEVQRLSSMIEPMIDE